MIALVLLKYEFGVIFKTLPATRDYDYCVNSKSQNSLRVPEGLEDLSV